MTLKGLRIVSDGTVTGTRVFANDGEDITRKLCIRAVRWEHKSGEAPCAVLTCNLAAFETSNVDSMIDVTNLASKAREYRPGWAEG